MPSILSIQYMGGREADFGNTKDRRCRRGWLVKTDGRFYSEASLLQDAVVFAGGAAGIPIPFVSTHPDSPQFLCKRLRGKQDRNAPLRWDVEAEYDTAPIDSDDNPESPLARPAKITWSTTKYQKAIERDRDGNAIINSAGDYFDPPPIADVSRWTASVTKNVAGVPTSILSYVDGLNSSTWEIDGVSVEANVAKVMSISIGEEQVEGDVVYRQFSYTVEFDPVDKWKGKYLNQGFYYKDGSNRKRILDANSKPVVTPKLLNSSGAVISDPTPSSATFKEYDVCSEIDFSVFPVA